MKNKVRLSDGTLTNFKSIVVVDDDNTVLEEFNSNRDIDDSIQFLHQLNLKRFMTRANFFNDKDEDYGKTYFIEWFSNLKHSYKKEFISLLNKIRSLN